MEYTIEPQIQDTPNMKDLKNEDIEQYLNGGKCIENSDKYARDYQCFNYALKDKDLFDCRHALEVLQLNYKRIGIRKAMKGDIISYHYSTGFGNILPNHFAIIVSTKGTIKETIVKSKWGNDGVFKGTIDDVPDYYGEIIAIWHKK